MAPLARHKPRRKRKPLPATQQCKLSPIEKLTAAPMALIRKPHQARRLPARWMPRMFDTDLEELQDHYYSSLRGFSATMEQDRPANRHCIDKELFAQDWDFRGGREGLKRFLSLPPTWPLARLMFPIRNLKKQMETLLQAYCFETAVTCGDAEAQGASIKRMALHLGQYIGHLSCRNGHCTFPASPFSSSERTGQRNECCFTHTDVLGAGHIHGAIACFQPVQSSSGKGTAETTQWAGQSCLSPLRWSSRAETWSQERH